MKRRGLKTFLALAVVLVVIMTLWANSAGLLLHRPSDPDPARNQGVAIDCRTGGGWIGHDGLTHCPD